MGCFFCSLMAWAQKLVKSGSLASGGRCRKYLSKSFTRAITFRDQCRIWYNNRWFPWNNIYKKPTSKKNRKRTASEIRKYLPGRAIKCLAIDPGVNPFRLRDTMRYNTPYTTIIISPAMENIFTRLVKSSLLLTANIITGNNTRSINTTIIKADTAMDIKSSNICFGTTR